jgi:hypothetical protein
LENIVTPEPRNIPAGRVHERVPSFVISALSVLAAVQLDNELELPTSKVGEIWSDRKLTNELEAIQTSISDFYPKLPFGIVVELTQAASTQCRFPVGSSHSLSLCPSP